ncbi:hypothetical protein DFH08DRAFT_1080311 [Mycena albidolilacea]|uniref:Transmembrane protein n=1 Tax=Mycena albidolilacea TaxID=1033008 RepID=A0AAD7ES00_9AGAR|nr:hypothetical protein DFH08DRAFT_1080311 [Mycena albidolilacea]
MLFTLIDDRDPSVAYTGTWVPGGTTHEKDGTVSSSVKAGDHFSLPFTGTAIAVYGTFDASSAGVKTSYAIDGGSLITVTSSSSGSDSFQQLFWQSPAMPDGSHQLVVTMVSVNKAEDGEGTVWFDYFNVTTDAVSPSSSSTPPSATASSPQDSGAALTTKKTSHGALIGGVVAGVVTFLLLGAACLLFLRLRRKREYAATSGGTSSSSMITPWTPAPAMSSTDGPPGSIPVPVPYNPAPRKGQQPHPMYAVRPVPSPETPYASSGASASSSLTHPTHTRPARSTAGSSSSSSVGNNSGSIAELKRQQQQVVNAYEEGINGGAPVQHVDSGVRQLAPTAAVELPPVYTAI